MPIFTSFNNFVVVERKEGIRIQASLSPERPEHFIAHFADAFREVDEGLLHTTKLFSTSGLGYNECSSFTVYCILTNMHSSAVQANHDELMTQVCRGLPNHSPVQWYIETVLKPLSPLT